MSASLKAFICSVLTVVLMLVLWPKIKLPFHNPEGLVGPLTQISYNPANNLIRYLLVVLTPLITIFVLHISGIYHIGISSVSQEENKFSLGRRSGIVYIFFIVLVVYYVGGQFLGFFSNAFNPGPLDFFHEGEFLTPAFNYLVEKKFWSGSFFVHGLFFDQLCTVLSWEILGSVGIGASRFGWLFWTSFIPIAFGLCLVAIVITLKKSASSEEAVTVGISVLTVYLLVKRLDLIFFDRRDILVLLVVALLVLYLAYNNSFLLITAGILSAIQVFVTIERAAYLFLATLVFFLLRFIAFPNIRRSLNECLLFITPYAITLATIFYFLGWEELVSFIDNFLYFSRYKDYFDSFIYPTPLFTSRLTAVIPILLISFQSIVMARLTLDPIFRKKPLYFIGGIFWSLSVVYFRSALGRSDEPHIAYASQFAYLGFAYFSAVILVRLYPQIIPYALTVLFCIVAITSEIQGEQLFKTRKHILNAPARIRELVAQPDDAFLSAQHIRIRNELEQIFSEQTEVFVYFSEPVWPYLLRKSSFTKYFVPWFASAYSRQKEIIGEFEKDPPALILTSSDPKDFDNISQADRFILLDKYIKQNYQFFRQIDKYIVLKRLKKK